jgi:leucyl-tRNA synthetase
MSGYGDIERKWQQRWSEKGLNEANRDDRPKFMLIFAYPGVTGYLHVGHMRGFSYVDAIGRYKRMTGYNVMFPVGAHATGNGSISLANKIRKELPEWKKDKSKDDGTIGYLLRNGCPEEKLESLTEPMNVVNFFCDVYVNEYWKRFGFLADWRRFTCTLYPDYAKFIQWQFRKLRQADMLIQKPYFAPACPNCGPVAVDASETDISKGGNAENQEYTLLKFRHGDEYLVAATLRPETLYGQVCFWVNPEVEYVKIKVNGETWIVSPQAAQKLGYQKDGIETVGKIPGREMIGWKCTAPMIHRDLPVFPAKFCDPDVGTGLVTSVPSDAPDDWISLEAVKKDPTLVTEYGIPQDVIDSAVPISIISMEGYGDFPAKDAIDRLGITQPGDPLLVEAKKQVYKDGYHLGKMKDNCGPYAGMPVDRAKDAMKDALLKAGEADVFHDLTEEVVCRCGQRVYIRKIDDQWFINYANQKVTDMTKEHCKTMDIQPVEYYNNVHGVLDWFRERACVRLGNWLGTKFPYDDKWTIEAISDSTLYPIYYLISKYTNGGEIKAEQLKDSFFDYAFLGKGDAASVSADTGIPKDLVEQIRKDVLYWYPLDLNLGGKEHMTVHFPAFLMNHVAILPKELWPRGIMVNWYITGKKNAATGKGDKISKSKGGAQPIPGAAEKFGVDGLRFYYAHIASPFADVEWVEETVYSYRQKLDRIISFVGELNEMAEDGPEGEIDRWIISRINGHVKVIRDAMDKLDLRQLATTTYFDMVNDIRWYVRRGGKNKATIRKILRTWINAMMPVTPHTAEELWAQSGFDGMVSEAQFPEYDESLFSADAEYGENLVRDVIADSAQIIKVTGIQPKRVVIYTASAWKRKVMDNAVALLKEGKLDIPGLTKRCMADEELRKNGKAVSDLAKKIAADYMRSTVDKAEPVACTDETALLSSASGFMSDEIGFGIEVFNADAEGIYDPKGKSKVAIPGRPAIYIE